MDSETTENGISADKPLQIQLPVKKRMIINYNHIIEVNGTVYKYTKEVIHSIDSVGNDHIISRVTREISDGLESIQKISTQFNDKIDSKTVTDLNTAAKRKFEIKWSQNWHPQAELRGEN